MFSESGWSLWPATEGYLVETTPPPGRDPRRNEYATTVWCFSTLAEALDFLREEATKQVERRAADGRHDAAARR